MRGPQAHDFRNSNWLYIRGFTLFGWVKLVSSFVTRRCASKHSPKDLQAAAVSLRVLSHMSVHGVNMSGEYASHCN